MSREALDSAEQVAPAGRGSGGASAVERDGLISILRPSGRIEQAWRLQELAGISLAHAVLPRHVRSMSEYPHQRTMGQWNEATVLLFASQRCLYQCDFPFPFEKYIPQRGYSRYPRLS